ncbi:hypothetical protein IAT38_000874 [Cryptococcus sp. DSM 104549]
MFSLTDPRQSFRAFIENTDTGLMYNEYNHNHFSTEDGTRSSVCYLEARHGEPFAIVVEMAHAFVRLDDQDWRAACFVDGQRLHGSYWEPGSLTHKVEYMYEATREGTYRCKMRFGETPHMTDSAPGEKLDTPSKYMGRIDVVLSRGTWCEAGVRSAGPQVSRWRARAAPEAFHQTDGSTTDKVKVPSREEARVMTFCEYYDEPSFYSFHFILKDRQTLEDYGVIHRMPPAGYAASSVASDRIRKRSRRDADDADSDEEEDLLNQIDILRSKLRRAEAKARRLSAANKRLRANRNIARTYQHELVRSLEDVDDTLTVM